jgi:hypothetical protein
MTGGHNNLVLKPARTEIRRNAFSIRVVQSWNRLPDDIKKSRTAQQFKNGLKRYLENGGRPG